MTIATTPAMMLISRWWVSSAAPRPPNAAPVVTKTAAMPATNSDVPSSILRRDALPSMMSEAPMPVAYDR